MPGLLFLHLQMRGNVGEGIAETNGPLTAIEKKIDECDDPGELERLLLERQEIILQRGLRPVAQVAASNAFPAVLQSLAIEAVCVALLIPPL